MGNTTHDPTELGLRFDPMHQDRLALQAVADRTVAAGVPNAACASWCCPVCDWRCTSSQVSQLLEHASSASRQRVAHERLLMFFCELLILEPPPPASSASKDSTFDDWVA